jgi:hypothetical protein
VKWLGYDNPKDNSWEPRADLGGDASTLIKDLVREETVIKAWRIAIAAAKKASTNTIDITFVDPAGMGLDFRSADNDQCFVYSIDDGGPAMKLSSNKLQIGALLVSVNDDSSYNPDRITMAEVKYLEAAYIMTFGQPPQGSQCKNASWLEAQILGAQHDAMEARADTGERSEQLLIDERLAEELAANDERACARSTRSAKRQADVVSAHDGEML